MAKKQKSTSKGGRKGGPMSSKDAARIVSKTRLTSRGNLGSARRASNTGKATTAAGEARSSKAAKTSASTAKRLADKARGFRAQGFAKMVSRSGDRSGSHPTQTKPVGNASSKALTRLQKVKKAAGTLPKTTKVGDFGKQDKISKGALGRMMKRVATHAKIPTDFSGTVKERKAARALFLRVAKFSGRKAQFPGMDTALKQKAKLKATAKVKKHKPLTSRAAFKKTRKKS